MLDRLDADLAEADAEALRAVELARRARSIIDGSADLVDADEVRRRIAARLHEVRTREVP